MKITYVVAALLANTSAIRLYAAPPPGLIVPKKLDSTAIDSEGRAKSESMPQYGGTATDDSKGGKMTHGEAKVNQKDVAQYRELSDTVLKNSNSV